MTKQVKVLINGGDIEIGARKKKMNYIETIEKIFKDYKTAVKLKALGALTTPPEILWDMAVHDLNTLLQESNEKEYRGGFTDAMTGEYNKYDVQKGLNEIPSLKKAYEKVASAKPNDTPTLQDEMKPIWENATVNGTPIKEWFGDKPQDNIDLKRAYKKGFDDALEGKPFDTLSIYHHPEMKGEE